METKRKIVRPSNYVRKAVHYETPTQPSKTKPDDSMTVREIYDRAIAGIEYTRAKQPMYDPNPSHDDFDLEKVPGMDIHDRGEIREINRERLREKAKAVNELNDKAKLKADKNAQDKIQELAELTKGKIAAEAERKKPSGNKNEA